MNPTHTLQICFPNIDFNIIHLPLCIPTDLVSLGFSANVLYAVLISPMYATCAAYLSLRDLIIIIFGEEYKVWCSSLCHFLQPSVISPLLQNILLGTLFSQNLNLRSSLAVRGQVSHSYKTPGEIVILFPFPEFTVF
jgi:hypothetical protein